MSARIYENFEGLVCDDKSHNTSGCSCVTLRKHYGSKLFRCPFPSCGSSKQGFPTRQARDMHIKDHSRPWKCPVPSCPWSDIGFATRGGQVNHVVKMHQPPQPSEPIDLAREKLSDTEIEALLVELTKAGDVEALQRLSSLGRLGRNWGTLNALAVALEMGSLPLVQVLSQLNPECRWWSSGWNSEHLPLLVKSGSADLFNWFLDKICRSSGQASDDSFDGGNIIASEAFKAASPDTFTAWQDFLVDAERDFPARGRDDDIDRETFHRIGNRVGRARNLIPLSTKRSLAFSEPAFNAVRKSAMWEARLIQTWRRLVGVIGTIDPLFLGWSMTCLGRSSNCSVPLVAELLRLGAPIDFPRVPVPLPPFAAPTGYSEEEGGDKHQSGVHKRVRKSRRELMRGMTTLFYVSRKKTEAAAQLMRFLLENGADPRHGWGGVKPAQQAGAAHMETLLGESWDDVVERSEEARKKRTRQPSESEQSNASEVPTKKAKRRAHRPRAPDEVHSEQPDDSPLHERLVSREK